MQSGTSCQPQCSGNLVISKEATCISGKLSMPQCLASDSSAMFGYVNMLPDCGTPSCVGWKQQLYNNFNEQNVFKIVNDLRYSKVCPYLQSAGPKLSSENCM